MQTIPEYPFMCSYGFVHFYAVSQAEERVILSPWLLDLTLFMKIQNIILKFQKIKISFRGYIHMCSTYLQTVLNTIVYFGYIKMTKL